MTMVSLRAARENEKHFEIQNAVAVEQTRELAVLHLSTISVE
jgi:hypothetical protein